MADGGIERDSMEYDVVIAGGGPAGLAAAIRIRQLAEAEGREVSVAVIEKGSEIGAHILSGVVFDPKALDELFPDWREDPDQPFDTEVTSDKFVALGEAAAMTFLALPCPASCTITAAISGLWAICAAGWPPAPRQWASRSIPASRPHR